MTRFFAMRAWVISATVVASSVWPARASSTEPRAPSAMTDTAFSPARVFVSNWCADCHSEGGTSPKHERAYRALRLDTYAQWSGHQSAIKGAIDKWHLDGKIMPPVTANAQPSDADRRRMLAWIARGSPNTASGK